MTFISITRLRLRSARYLPAFLWHTLVTRLQAQRAPGCRRVDTAGGMNLAFWTRTAWDSEAAMRAYMNSGAHRGAMPKLRHWCDEASVVHWEQESDELPSWSEAHRRMIASGRPSKVAHPSADHLTLRIPEPRG